MLIRRLRMGRLLKPSNYLRAFAFSGLAFPRWLVALFPRVRDEGEASDR
jgi:hypothetical protein